MLSPRVNVANMTSSSHSLRVRASTIKPGVYKLMNMADNTTQKEMSPDCPSSVGVDRKKRKSATAEGHTEQFPEFSTKREVLQHKPKSYSASDVPATTPFDEDRNTAIERIKSVAAPLTLEECRQRRASMKEDAKEARKASISFIRSRTASRVEASGRPNLEDIQGPG